MSTNAEEYPLNLFRFDDLADENPNAEHFFDLLYNCATERGQSAAASRASFTQHEADAVEIPGLVQRAMDHILYRVKCRVSHFSLHV